MTTASRVEIERDAPIPTWFGIGGGADRLARPATIEEIAACVEVDRDLRVLGDGANLLVGDAGVSELVVSLDRLATWSVDDEGDAPPAQPAAAQPSAADWSVD